MSFFYKSSKKKYRLCPHRHFSLPNWQKNVRTAAQQHDITTLSTRTQHSPHTHTHTTLTTHTLKIQQPNRLSRRKTQQPNKLC